MPLITKTLMGRMTHESLSHRAVGGTAVEAPLQLLPIAYILSEHTQTYVGRMKGACCRRTRFSHLVHTGQRVLAAGPPPTVISCTQPPPPGKLLEFARASDMIDEHKERYYKV